MKKPDWREWIKNQQECRFWLDNYVKKGMLIKSKREENLYFKKSEHNLNFANWLKDKPIEKLRRLFDDSFYDWVIVGCYYTIYHSALALITKKGFSSKLLQ